MVVDWSQAWQILALPIISGMFGFLQTNWANYMIDNKFDKFEWTETIKTLFKLGIPAFAAWLVLNGFGVEVNAWAAALIPISAYWISRIFKTDTVSLNKTKAK